MTAILLLLMIQSPVPERVVDICERNTIYNVVLNEGLNQFFFQEQCSFYVWWDLHPDGEYHVVDWRGAGDLPTPVNNVQEWWDPKTKRTLRVRHRVYRDVSSTYDRETEDRRICPEERRHKF